MQIIENKGRAQYTAITKKWDARQDLAGKTRYEIIKLFKEDVEDEYSFENAK